MIDITTEMVANLLPRNKNPEVWAQLMNTLMPNYGITTEAQAAAFIAQAAHESNQFTVLEENLYYSTTGLNRVFSKYFKKAGRDAKAYAKKPEAIANVVYADRMGNGDTASGDGYRYRGRGIFQLTGKNNYAAFAKSLDVDLDDELLAYITTPAGAMDSALWYWQSNNLNNYVSDFKKLTKQINGGYNGLKDRQAHYAHALAVFGGEPGQPAPGDSSRALGIGDRGDDVKAMQKALGIHADGHFGPQTKRAVTAFQAQNGLVVDGVAGSKTLTLLYK